MEQQAAKEHWDLSRQEFANPNPHNVSCALDRLKGQELWVFTVGESETST